MAFTLPQANIKGFKTAPADEGEIHPCTFSTEGVGTLPLAPCDQNTGFNTNDAAADLKTPYNK